MGATHNARREWIRSGVGGGGGVSAARVSVATQHPQEIGLRGDTHNILYLAQTGDTCHLSLAVSRWELPCASLGNDWKVMHWLRKENSSYDRQKSLRSKQAILRVSDQEFKKEELVYVTSVSGTQTETESRQINKQKLADSRGKLCCSNENSCTWQRYHQDLLIGPSFKNLYIWGFGHEKIDAMASGANSCLTWWIFALMLTCWLPSGEFTSS